MSRRTTWCASSNAFVDGLDLAAASFSRVEPKVTGRPGYAPADLLKLYIYGYLNRVQSSRRLETETHRCWPSRLTPRSTSPRSSSPSSALRRNSNDDAFSRGRADAKAKGVKFGRKLAPAERGLAVDETQRSVAQSHNVSQSTMSRLVSMVAKMKKSR